MTSIQPSPINGKTVLRGRDHPQLGAKAVARVGSSLALAMSAGARAKALPALDPNEDVAAIVHGSRADLLVVADGHFGREASELAVDHVLEAIGDDPPPADLSDDELVTVFFDAGVTVQREISRPDCPHPNSRTTLALALVSDGAVQWAALGDSCVVLATTAGGARLEVPRNAYLGYRFAFADVAAALTRGRAEWNSGDCLVLATDGLVDAVELDGLDIATVVSRELGSAADAARAAEVLLQLALAKDADDAVTIAVAATQSS
jgi:serine/threonine protein phosphatase PrpC